MDVVQYDWDSQKYVFVPGALLTSGEFPMWLEELNRMKMPNPMRNFTDEEIEEDILPEGQRTHNHPDYYGGEDNVYEVIKIIEHYNLSFCAGNALKYLIRAGKKMLADEIHDLNKGLWYYKREIENRIKEKNANKT